MPRLTHSTILAALFVAAASPIAAQTAPPATPPGFATVRGVATDSIRHQPLSNALVVVEGTPRIGLADASGNFQIDSIPPGSYRLSLSHPVLDTLGMLVMTELMVMRPGETLNVELATPTAARIVSLRCPAAILQLRGPAALMGQVQEPDSLKAAAGAKVQLVYQETLLGFKGQPIVREATVDSTGNYRICGLPTPITGKLQVFLNGVSTGQVDVDIDGSLGLRSLSIAATARVSTVADTGGKTRRLLSGNSRLRGRVLSKAGAAIQSARVSVDGASSVAITNEKGEFLLDSLPSGTQTLEVRKIGYAATDKAIEVSARTIASATITLDVAELAPMKILAGSERVLSDMGYEDRKHRGVGYFIDGDRLSQEAVRFSDAMRTAPGIRVIPVGNGRLTLTNARDPNGCVTTWVDRVVWRELSPGDLDDFVTPGEIRAVEVYSASTTPAEFQAPGSTSCATIVVWTNRYVNRRIKK